MWLHFGTVLAQKVCRSQGRATASEATLWRPRQERRKTVWEEQPGFPHAVGHCSAAPKPVGTLYPPQRCPEYSSLSPGSHSQYVAPRNLILSPALNWLLFFSLHLPLLNPLSIKDSCRKNHQQLCVYQYPHQTHRSQRGVIWPPQTSVL